jgi:glycerate kinase
MLIAIAPDSFKGTLTAEDAARAVAAGLKRGLPGTRFRLIPMADGGEGTVDAVIASMRGKLCRCRVHDPLGRPFSATYGRVDGGRRAVMEMAAASGLPLLKPAERNPLITSTVGTGDLLRHAVEQGAQQIWMGIGGSATNDGGTGMARALGVRFLDKQGRELPPGGGALVKLARVDVSKMDPHLRKIKIEVACDVDNPLCGPRGASAIYGPQKGATPTMVRQLDAGLRRLAEVVRRDLGVNVAEAPGAGAAGGLGFGLMVFCGARLRRGVEMVADAIKLEDRLRGCDLVITGEGRMDGQTVNGKTPMGVARVAKRVGVPVIAICGCTGDGWQNVHKVGISAVFSATTRRLTEEEVASGAADRLSRTAEEIGRLIALGR